MAEQENPPPAPRLPARLSGYDIAAWALAVAVLILVLHLRLLPALVSGLLVYELVHLIAPRLRILRRRGETGQGHGDSRGRLIAVTMLAAGIAALLILAVVTMAAFFRSDAGSIPALLNKVAAVVENVRASLPQWAADIVPDDGDEIKVAIVNWLRTHATDVTGFGESAVRGLAHTLIGLVIGALVALRHAVSVDIQAPLARALIRSATRLGDAFGRIVFAQVRISLLNTALTAAYLAVILPMLDIRLPLVKSMILVTFVAGLLPVIGNLVSNTLIVVISLGFSLYAAIASLTFLVLIHKLEYFVNARIIGSKIRSSAWELLLAMLFMEAAFGFPGLIAAPFYYAYVKDELQHRGFV